MRPRPEQIKPVDAAGAPLADGSYVLDVTDDVVTLIPEAAGTSVATDAIWDAKGDLVAASAANTAARLPVGSDGHVLTADSGQTLGVKWAAPAAGTTLYDRRWVVGSGETSLDEFNDDSLSGSWSRVDGTGAAVGTLNWVEGADSLSAVRVSANTSNIFSALVRSIGTAPTTGDAWVTCVTLFGQQATNYMVGGIVVTDGTTHGAGKQVTAELINDATSGVGQRTQAITWTNFGTVGTVGTGRVSVASGTPVHLRLVYKGSSQWRADTSPNGVSWILGASLVTQSSFTPSHIGLYSRDGASGLLSVASYEYFRRVSGVS